MTTRSVDVIRLSSSLKIAQPEAVKALEQAWQKRRRELGSWQPSGGWLIDPRLTQARSVHSS